MKNFLITLCLGWSGIHRFMQKKYATGVIWLCTFGLFGIGWIVDIVTAFKHMSNEEQADNTDFLGNNSTSQQFIKSFDTVIVGTFAKCDLDSDEKREDVIMRIRKNNILDLKFWRYKGEPACYVCYNGSDAGNLRAGLAKILHEEYKDCTFKVTAVERIMDERHNCLTYNIRIDIYR